MGVGEVRKGRPELSPSSFYLISSFFMKSQDFSIGASRISQIQHLCSIFMNQWANKGALIDIGETKKYCL